MDLRMVELKWLASQDHPVWGGHLARGEPLSDQQMQQWLNDGIIEVVANQTKAGYRITEKGRALVRRSR